MVLQGTKISDKNYIYDLDPHANRRHVKTGSTKALEIYIEEICENKKLHVFTFNLDTLTTYSWKEIIENNLYENKKDYSLAEVKHELEIKLIE